MPTQATVAQGRSSVASLGRFRFRAWMLAQPVLSQALIAVHEDADFVPGDLEFIQNLVDALDTP